MAKNRGKSFLSQTEQHPPISAEILTLGNELLNGSTLNTNASFLGRELTTLGFEVSAHVSCPDVIDRISEKLGEALSRANLVILSGGLGPTPDDLTREGIAKFFRVGMVFSKKQYALIRKFYYHRGRRVPAIVKREAMFPANAIPLVNRFGIALGFYIVCGERLVIVLPGVPTELEKMFEALVRPLLAKHFPTLSKKPSLVVKMVGVSEPHVMACLGNDFFEDPFQFGIYPAAGEVAIRIQAEKPQIIKRLRAKISKRLEPSIYAYEDLSLAEVVSDRFLQGKKTLAVAESCTGGLLASEITKIPGASRYLVGAVVAYQNRVKCDQLEVPEKLLAKHGAVSAEVAKAMARGVREVMGASYGIAVTGIAGPTGGTTKKPVGLVFIALAGGRRCRVWKENFWGSREQIQRRTMKRALEYLWREVTGKS